MPRSQPTLRNVYPGEVLQEEFLQELEISQYRLAKDIGVPATRISEIVKGSRSVTADTAIRLGLYFGTTPNFWTNLQTAYDLEHARKTFDYDTIPTASRS